MTRHWLTVVLLAAALVAAGCSHPNLDNESRQQPISPATSSLATDIPPTATRPPDPGGRPAAKIPDPAQVDMADPDQVAKAAVTAIYTIDTRTDSSPVDAYRRAAPWLTTELAASLAAAPTAGGADWLTLVEHDGYTVITDLEISSEYGQPTDTADTDYRTITYRTETIYRDQAAGPAVRADAVHLRLTNVDLGWKVTGFLP